MGPSNVTKLTVMRIKRVPDHTIKLVVRYRQTTFYASGPTVIGQWSCIWVLILFLCWEFEIKFLKHSSSMRKDKNLAQSWTALYRAFSSHRQPSSPLTKLFPSFFFFFCLWIFGNVWSLWDGSGSSFESCRHFFKHPQPLWVKVFPSWTRLLAELDKHQDIPQLDKTLGRTGQTLRACTAAETL